MLPLMALIASALPAQAAAQEAEIVVHGDSSRFEIERILDADNVDTARLEPRLVVAAMAAIERGRAPNDFWLAYRAHLRAWQRFAEAEGRLRGQAAPSLESREALVRAQQAIDASFDEVERIARKHGAGLPVPHP